MKIIDLKTKMRVFQKLANIDMAVSVAWKIQKNIAVIEKDFQIAEKLKDDLIRKYGEDDGKGNIVVLDEDKKLLVVDEINKLDNTETENEIVFTKIKISELGNIKISPADLYLLNDVFTEDDE